MAGLDRAIAIAAVEFEGKFDKGGKPYILHCLYVMNKVRHVSVIAMIAAVLHDLIEDTKWTFDDLRVERFSEEVITIIDCLTHRNGEAYEDYIKRISVNRIATLIKLRDLEHNCKVTRMKGLRKKDFDRLEKYLRAVEYLRGLYEC